MATTRYGYLIKPLGLRPGRSRPKKYYEANNTGKETAKIAQLNGRDKLEGLDLSLSWEYHDGLGRWYGEEKPRVNAYPQVLFFVGLDTAAINYLGADVECCLGADMKPYQFSEPTVVVVPAGVPYGPVTTRRMYSPRGLACYRAALTTAPGKGAVAGPDAAGGKSLAGLVKPLKNNILIQRKKMLRAPAAPKGRGPAMTLGPGNADHLAWFYGKDLEGLNANMDWGFFSSPGLWHRGVGGHVHPAPEILVFAGTDPSQPGSLGAEIEVDLGKEHERHLVSEPSVIVCPAGLPHGPFVTQWVDRPFAFFSVNLNGEPGMTFVD
jgi:hypothetical protein